jgi:hypothetical protein
LRQRDHGKGVWIVAFEDSDRTDTVYVPVAQRGLQAEVKMLKMRRVEMKRKMMKLMMKMKRRRAMFQTMKR